MSALAERVQCLIQDLEEQTLQAERESSSPARYTGRFASETRLKVGLIRGKNQRTYDLQCQHAFGCTVMAEKLNKVLACRVMLRSLRFWALTLLRVLAARH